jgi:plasmid maintenance system antidote protein VapI
LSQSDVGQALYGRDAKNRICEYETGAQRPSVETIYRLAKVLGCSADYLLGLSAEYETNLDTARYGAMYSMLQDTSKHINQTIATMMMVQLRKVPTSLTCTLMAQADDVDYYLGNIRQHTAFDKKVPGAANLISAVENLSRTADKMRKQLQEQMRSLERAVQDSHLNDDAAQGHLMAWDVVEPIPAPKVRKA